MENFIKRSAVVLLALGFAWWAALSCAAEGTAAPASPETKPPRPEIHLIVVAGQSNCVGYDTMAQDLPPDPADRDILFMFDVGGLPPYDDGKHNSSSKGQWVTLQTQPAGELDAKGLPKDMNFRTATGGFGPEMSIARALHASGMKNLAVMKFAYGTTGFRLHHWNPGDPLNRGFMNRYAQALKGLDDKGYDVKLEAVFWHQGESDAGSTKEEYIERFKAFAADVRGKWNCPQLPFIISVSTPEYWRWGGPQTAESLKGRNRGMGAIQEALAQTDPHFFYVDDIGCERSKICGHYSSSGTIDIGQRMARKYLENCTKTPVK